jgi:carbon storage regulator CsrA
MLVLSRKSHQQIRIGDKITISILKVRGNVVSVGIEAPADVRVMRGELPRFGEQTHDEPSARDERLTEADLASGEQSPKARTSTRPLRSYLAARRGRPRASGPLRV